MLVQLHSTLHTVLVAAAPVLLVVAGLFSPSWASRYPLRAARLAVWCAACGLAASCLAALLTFTAGPASASLAAAGPLVLSVYVDGLAALVLVLVSFLLMVVLAFSVRYMAGEPGHARFTRWLCLTGAAVVTMIVSGNLLQFVVAWTATSLCLHRLLVFYGDRPSALLAARKKFIVSRLGDVCLLAALLLVYAELGTWDYAALWRAELAHPDVLAVLLASAAILKSAQVPFHTWLPDTMDAPTPVSALMHAGVINAGGFLIMRMSPVMGASSSAMAMLAWFGALTAVVGAVVMLTQASVKRALAFSTVAQMGFMLFECGVGAFGLALLHLVAHSLYKAHAFLGSGSVVGAGAASRTAVVTRGWPRLAFGAVAATGAVFGGASLLHVDLQSSTGSFVLACACTAALATVPVRICGDRPTVGRVAASLGVVVLVAALYLELHQLFGTVLSLHGPGVPVTTGTMVAYALLFGGLFVLQAAGASLWNHPWMHPLYVHARNGFYVNTLANRLTLAVWPIVQRRAYERG